MRIVERLVAGRATALAVLVLLTMAGCWTPERAVARADREAYAIVSQRSAEVRGEPAPFDVTPQRGRVADELIDPETGLVPEGSVVHVSLADALELAARNSRDFQDAKESLFRAALNLINQRETYRASPFAFTDANVRSALGNEDFSGGAEFGISRTLRRGGSIVTRIGLSGLRILSGGGGDALGSFAALDIQLPFLRNAGRWIAAENLVQADRDVLYALRSFERFKQTFGVRVVSDYLRLLSDKQQIANEEANLKSLRLARERNESLAQEGRLAVIQVDQARQQELQGENRLLTTTQSYEAALDRFKNLLGLPIDCVLELEPEDIERLELEEIQLPDFGINDLLALSLRARLDFRNTVDVITDVERRIKIAENDLLPTLTIDLGARIDSRNLKPLTYDLDTGTYSAGVDYDLGLDRDVEAVVLRRALLDRQRALRAQEAFAESVKLEVRAALRQLNRARETYRIQKRAVELAEIRVRSTRTLLELGRSQTRDFLESQDALIRSQNSLINALIEYRIAYLDLFRDTGTLVVSPTGLDHETSIELLAGD